MKIIATFFKPPRFYVKVSNGYSEKTMPRANFVWLKANPSFESIPKGYVVHHLDFDPTNDDPSNFIYNRWKSQKSKYQEWNTHKRRSRKDRSRIFCR
jgi:hypothetical protein